MLQGRFTHTEPSLGGTVPFERPMIASLSVPSLTKVQSEFLTVLPRITRHARCYFRHVRCQHKKADFVSEVVSICWKWWLRLVQLGRNPGRFVSALATYAAKAVHCGRRVCGQLKAKDAMSERAQQRHGFSVGKLLDQSTLSATIRSLRPLPTTHVHRCLTRLVSCRFPVLAPQPQPALPPDHR